MRYLDKSWERIFNTVPDAGSAGNPAANQAGGGGDSSTQSADPFAGMDMEDFDPATRAQIEKAKTEFASLQVTAKAAAAKAEDEEKQRRMFQSRYDQTDAQLKKLTGGGGPQPNAEDQAKASQIDGFMKTLVSRGVAPENAKVQAEMMQDMLGQFKTQIKAEIGADLQPFASNVILRDAEHAFSTVRANDITGALQDDTIATEVWNNCQTLVQQGQQVTPEIVKNFTGMAYFNALETGKAPQVQLQSQPTPPVSRPFPSFGRATFPGAGAAPGVASMQNPNGVKTLDAATDKALQTVLGTWAKDGVKAPDFRGIVTKR